MPKALQNKPVLVILIMVLLMLGWHLDSLQVSIMEARNFITAREMLTDNNWLLTTMNGEARYQKPPLPSWINACFAALLGIKSTFAMRLPAILMVAVVGIYTFFISKKLTKSSSHALNNALIVITSFYVIGITFEAPSDIFTHGFMLIGIYQLFLLFRTQKQYIKHSLIAGIFIGASILSKGPVSFYALLLPFLLAYGLSFKYTFNKRLVLSFVTWFILALLIGGWWYFYVRVYDAETFQTIASRETENWSSYNVRPFYYYWSFFVQSGLWTIPAFISLLYPYMKTRVGDLKAYKFSFWWTILAVILLSIIPEKKSRYLMPVLIPLAINTGFYIQYIIKHFKTMMAKRDSVPVYVNFGLIALIALALPVIIYIFVGETLADHILSFTVLSLIGITCGILILVYLKKKRMANVFNVTIAFFAGLLVFGFPISEALKSTNYKPISGLESEAKSANLSIYSFNYVAPETIWQFGDKLPPLKVDEDIVFPEAHQFGVIANGISPEDQQILKDRYHIEHITTYDLNTTDPKAKSYKGRLMSHYYMFTKK